MAKHMRRLDNHPDPEGVTGKDVAFWLNRERNELKHLNTDLPACESVTLNPKQAAEDMTIRAFENLGILETDTTLLHEDEFMRRIGFSS